MRDTKPLLLFSLVLFLLSAVLLSVLGYQYYHQLKENKSNKQTKKPPPGTNDSSKDSILKLYKSTLNSLAAREDRVLNIADSLKGSLDINMNEFYKVRSDIAALLQEKSNNKDLVLTREKLVKLQLKLDELLDRNVNVDRENIKLHTILEQLTKQPGENVQSIRQVSNTDNPAIRKGNLFAPISTDNLNLSAIALNSQQETNQAKNAEKLIGSFTVKNNSSADKRYDVVVVVLQPDGEVIQKSAWESGTFETNEGKKIYSCKLRFEASQGETSPLNFSLSADHYQKGNYTMQIYHNGVMIGKLSKTLS